MNAKSIGIVAILAVVAAIAWPQLRKSSSRSAAAERNFLPNLIVDVNKRLPANPGPDIVFYRADMKEGMLTYNMRVDNTDANNLSPDEKAAIRKRITQVICEDADATKVRDAGLTVRGNIGDRTGTPIGSVAVLPNGC